MMNSPRQVIHTLWGWMSRISPLGPNLPMRGPRTMTAAKAVPPAIAWMTSEA